jgi:hypothetical protein
MGDLSIRRLFTPFHVENEAGHPPLIHENQLLEPRHHEITIPVLWRSSWALRNMQHNCEKRGKDSLAMKKHNIFACVDAEAARKGHERPKMIINEEK